MHKDRFLTSTEGKVRRWVSEWLSIAHLERREKGDDGDVLEGFSFWGKLVHSLGQTGHVGKGRKGWSCCQAQGTGKPRDLHRIHCAPLLWQCRHPAMSHGHELLQESPYWGALSKCLTSTEAKVQGRYSETVQKADRIKIHNSNWACTWNQAEVWSFKFIYLKLWWYWLFYNQTV